MKGADQKGFSRQRNLAVVDRGRPANVGVPARSRNRELDALSKNETEMNRREEELQSANEENQRLRDALASKERQECQLRQKLSEADADRGRLRQALDEAQQPLGDKAPAKCMPCEIRSLEEQIVFVQRGRWSLQSKIARIEEIKSTVQTLEATLGHVFISWPQ